MPIAKKNIPHDFLEQMKTNLTKTSDNNSVTTAEETESEEAATAFTKMPPSASAPKKGKYADVMNVRLSTGRRDEIKRFCTNCGVTVTQYIESSFEFLAKEVAAGHIIISKGGITKVD